MELPMKEQKMGSKKVTSAIAAVVVTAAMLACVSTPAPAKVQLHAASGNGSFAVSLVASLLGAQGVKS
jgi:hypothetical protein